MTWPNKPTHITGKYVITSDIHGPCSANWVTDANGNRMAVYVDDSAPYQGRTGFDSVDHWVQIASGQCHHPLVLVSIPPGPPPHRRHFGTNVWNMLEVYWWGFGREVADAWYDPLPFYGAYIIQWEWLGPHGHNPIPQEEKDHWLKVAQSKNPKYGIWKF